MIEIRELSKTYGKTIATDITHLEIVKGERVGLVGNNGAGKTTMISLMLDLIKPDAGQVDLLDITVNLSDEWKKDTAAFLDETFLIDYLTPDEYFKFISRVRDLDPETVESRLNELEPFFNGQIRGTKKYIRDLSKGNKKKVGIAGAILGKPKLLFLDEPFANLDPSSQFQLQQLISDLGEEMTIFVSSHDLTHISQVCKRIIILENGKIVADMETNPNTLVELKSYFTAKSDVNEI